MYTLAIIGIGPRGLFALEQLLQHLSISEKKLRIIGFEPEDNPGAGQVWRIDQDESNWANITESALVNLQGRTQINYQQDVIQSFPSYSDWIQNHKKDSEPDVFPLRAKVGTYLSERFTSLKIQKLTSISFKLIAEKVTIAKPEKDILQLITENGNCYDVNDVLLTIGHQPTKLSSQMKSWKAHASKHNYLKVFENCYPISRFDYLENENKKVIGIRGFGLTMVDVMRALAKNCFGRFEITNPNTFETLFVKNQDKKFTLIPFSLDGQPLAPKPLNQTIDKLFKPSDLDLKSLKAQLESVAQTHTKTESINFLIEPIAEISAKVFTHSKLKSKLHSLDNEQLKDLALQWLENEDIKHELILDKDTPTCTLIKKFIDMALHRDDISFDYCLGQVWRHCQPTIYTALSHSLLDNDLIKRIVDLDNRIKRYSYGPPVESMQQMLALVDANILNLNYVEDPKIELNENGWTLINSKDEAITTTVMIDSVLDAPKLLEVESPLIKNLLSDDLIQPLHSELGIETNSYGIVKSSNKSFNARITLLGRLSKGSVIGTDAILECFGKQAKEWASNYVKKLN